MLLLWLWFALTRDENGERRLLIWQFASSILDFAFGHFVAYFPILAICAKWHCHIAKSGVRINLTLRIIDHQNIKEENLASAVCSFANLPVAFRSYSNELGCWVFLKKTNTRLRLVLVALSYIDQLLEGAHALLRRPVPAESGIRKPGVSDHWNTKGKGPYFVCFLMKRKAPGHRGCTYNARPLFIKHIQNTLANLNLNSNSPAICGLGLGLRFAIFDLR